MEPTFWRKYKSRKQKGIWKGFCRAAEGCLGICVYVYTYIYSFPFGHQGFLGKSMETCIGGGLWALELGSCLRPLRMLQLGPPLDKRKLWVQKASEFRFEGLELRV